MEDEKFLTIKELQEALQISERTVYNWIEWGMPCFKVKQVIRFRLSEVVKWSEKRNNK